jgi:hypothetical protein
LVQVKLPPDAKISAAAPAGGWTTPNLAMAATARAVDNDCFIHMVRASTCEIDMEITRDMIWPKMALRGCAAGAEDKQYKSVTNAPNGLFVVIDGVAYACE